MDELDEDERAYIIPNAYSLMNLFMTAPFSVREMEDAVKEEKSAGKWGSRMSAWKNWKKN